MFITGIIREGFQKKTYLRRGSNGNETGEEKYFKHEAQKSRSNREQRICSFLEH
jgi:hypothetical protein